MKKLIEHNFNIVMLIGGIAGLFMPLLDELPKYSPIIILAMIIFFSCARVTLADLQTIDKKAACLFYIVRFIIFPSLTYYIILLFSIDYALPILLVSLMPVGVGSAAVTSLIKGNTSFALSSALITNALAPIIIPLMIVFLVGDSINIDISKMLMTLIISVLLPAILYFMVARPITAIKLRIKDNAQFASTFLLGILLAVAIAMQREYFLHDIGNIIMPTIIGCGLFFIFYIIGWIFASSFEDNNQKTYAVCSGVNNISLGVAIAALYFSPFVVLFTVLCEIPWVIGVALFKRFCENKSD